MSLWHIVGGYLRRGALTAGLNALMLAIGMAIITVLLLFAQQLEERLERDARGIDLVVGAKGSPLQLILSSIFHIDVPTGNIPMEDAQWVREHPLVEQAIPLALGDSFRGVRIVGTEPAYIAHYSGRLREGSLWEDHHGAVLGAAAAARTGLATGDVFHGVHGITSERAEGGVVHTNHPYRVSGILEPTGSVLDRLILVSVESVWKVHAPGEHWSRPGDMELTAAERYLTALLVRYRTPLAAAMLPRLVDARGPLQAASPPREMARLLQMLGIGLETLRLFGWLLVVMAGAGFFATLYHALRERRYDLALMRVLGATRRRVVGLLLLESMLLAGVGAVIGLALGHAVAEILGRTVHQAGELGIGGGVVLPELMLLLGAALLVGLAAGLLPAWQAYRTDIADTLQRHGNH